MMLRASGRTMRASLSIAVLVCASACAPRITRFTVTPHHVCSGSPVTLDWDAHGCTSVSSDPQLSARAGGTYVPTQTTTFTLTARRWPRKPDTSQTEATVYEHVTADTTDDIAFDMTCKDGKLAGRPVDRPVAEWDTRLRVAGVESAENRTMTIEHEGRTATLTARKPTTSVFDGTMLGGTWTVIVPLLPAEKCDDASHRPPDLVLVTAHVRCTE